MKIYALIGLPIEEMEEKTLGVYTTRQKAIKAREEANNDEYIGFTNIKIKELN